MFQIVLRIQLLNKFAIYNYQKKTQVFQHLNPERQLLTIDSKQFIEKEKMSMSISSYPQWINNSRSKVVSSPIPIQQSSQQRSNSPHIQQQTRQYTTVFRYQNNETVNNIQQNGQSSNLMSPQQMIKGLLVSANNSQPCNCASSTQYQSSELNTHQQVQQQQYDIDRQQIVRQIEKMEDQLNNMDSQVIQAQNMLNIRDNLYQQLDNLRIQREKIEDELQSLQQQQELKRERSHNKNKKSKNIIVKQIKSHINGGTVGLREMNDRLRRRIYEVKQYIDKMSIQNERIEEAIVDTIASKQNAGQSITYKKYNSLNHYYSQPRFHENHNDYSFAKTNQYFEEMRRRLQSKQQEAWVRLRTQQDQIAERNRSTINRVNQLYPVSQGRENLNSRFHTSYG